MKCLIVIATSDACSNELGAIRQALKTHQVEATEIEWISQDDFIAQIGQPSTEKYNLVYLAAHAGMHGFGGAESSLAHSWENLANAICLTTCMLPGATLFLGCCRGGMKTVALGILLNCDQIDYICGPAWNTKGTKLIQAFNSFAACKFGENLEPSAIKDRVSSAAGQQFNCFDRQELESEVAMLRQVRYIEWGLQQLKELQVDLSAQISSLHADVVKLLPKEPEQSQSATANTFKP
jgi:hypothetical protein